ncbi:MAG: toprim domain-containing protein, partial [Acholeplasmataceae bacterium]
MKETLIIVESPSKAKTIQSYLGKGTTVLSSVGHIRDLATSGVGGLGIDIENDFTPKYVVSTKKKKVVSEIKKEAKGKQVLIATDQDREGEAIGWHLAQILDLDTEEANRIVFTEITKNTITEAIKHPRKIDLGLVNSQEARRMLDRIIGFKLSGLLQSKLKSKSAGRVQSVALKLIVDLE